MAPMTAEPHSMRIRPIDFPAASDLRRKVSRDDVEALLDRAQHLAPRERSLIEAIYRDGAHAADIARIQGRDPKSVRRRLRRLTNRMASPLFLFVVRRRDEWAPTRRRVATACVLHGQSLRRTAQALGVSLHVVRRHMDTIKTLHEAERS